MKKFPFSFLLLFIAITSNPQLKVNNSGKVGIYTSITNLQPRLTVENIFPSNASVGIASTHDVMNKNNIGVEGAVSANSNYTNDKNYSVLSIVSFMNNCHSKNYGISDMIEPFSQHYGGVGIYATNYDYFYTCPTNIHGANAANFVGDVYTSSSLVATSSLSKRKTPRLTTLYKLRHNLNLCFILMNHK